MRGALGCDVVWCARGAGEFIWKNALIFQAHSYHLLSVKSCSLHKPWPLFNHLVLTIPNEWHHPPHTMWEVYQWAMPCVCFLVGSLCVCRSCYIALYREMLGKHRKQCIHWSCSLTVIDCSPECGPMWNPLICHLLFGFHPNLLQIPPTHI